MTWLARLRIRVLPSNSLVNGYRPSMRVEQAYIASWPNLNFDAAWIDNGPSPAGNRGPYLKVPGGDDSVHRVYCKHQPGGSIVVARTRGAIASVRPVKTCNGWVWVVEIDAQ